MHGRGGGEERKRLRHMWTVPTRVTAVLSGDGGGSPSLSSSTVNSFCKDGRKISVGDCALFRPPQDSPPFIGIIRCLITDKENKLNLEVNWLYRPAEVKLGKGILLEAAPNEVFYSFHKDEIPAASLLHPCKVAFLPKGIELPSGICSFVCRRVYDISNGCLWWLTDQDYINERQEEVDQLLYKTRLEMHATVQPGGRSPKPMNGPASQLKPGSDSVQNSASSFPSQAKGKKRERGDQGSEPTKRERTSKLEDGDSGHGRPETNLKSEISKITEKGGLEDSEGVEKLVQLMLPDRNEKKIDLVSRSMLAGVVAATDKVDCLSRFVQLRGLPVFDEWLQEAHKGKIGDGSGSKENDKSIEEFLLVLLRALDKLPVNLHALQMCNIGKSVNHLRSHKNLEIQKKARSLVDTWKKRVEAEMDAKSGSNQAVPWPARPRLSDVSHGGSKHSGTTEVATKSSVTQLSASKSGSVKLMQGENTNKSASPGSVKAVSPASAGMNLKEGQSRNAITGAISDPQAVARDEKSSSSSQSHNNSQSCSSDHARTGGVSGKEEARSSAGGTGTGNKVSSGSSRHRKSINGFPGPSLSGAQRETGSSKNSSLHRNPTPEKISHSGLTCDKPADVPMAEGNGHKLIVKIPNRGRSPARSASAGSFEDHSVVNSGASSPVLSEKQEQFERNSKEKGDSYRASVTGDVNTESWQSNDFKDVLTGSDEGDGSPAAPDEEQCRTSDDARKVTEVSKTASSSSGNELKSGKLQEASFSSINALIDSCVKYSEANACMPTGDDAGMNLLASVAAGEISKSNVASPVGSPQRNAPVVEQTCTGNDSKVKSATGEGIARDRSHSVEGVDDEHHKLGVLAGTAWARNVDGKTGSSHEKSVAEVNGNVSSSRAELPQLADSCLENGKLKDIITAALVNLPSAGFEKTHDVRDSKEPVEKKAVGGAENDSGSDSKQKGSGPLLNEDKVTDPGVKIEKDVVQVSPPLPEIVDEDKKNINEGLDRSLQTQLMSPLIMAHSAKGTEKEVLPSAPGKDLVLENGNEVKAEKDDNVDALKTEKQKPERETVNTPKGENLEENLEAGEVHKVHGGPSTSKTSPSFPGSETEQRVRLKGSNLTGGEADEAEERTSTSTDLSSATAGPDVDAKVEFDLNEGFNTDEGKFGETNNLVAPACSAPVSLISPMAFPISSVSSSLPASITVAAAAKGPFVPPDDLLRTKGALGWKGSAATSAFRPAEPRKVLEVPPATSNSALPDASAGKQSRPPLDIDLNVPDERVLEDLASRSSVKDADSAPDLSNTHDLTCGLIGSTPARSSGGLDLDLNRVDEPTDLGGSTNSGRRLDVSLQPVKSSSGVLNGEASVRRDFDLNNGPVVDEVCAEPSLFGQHTRSSNIPAQPPISSLRINNTDMANFSSWFSTGNTYSAVTIPSILPDRGEQPFPVVATGGPQRVLGPPTGATPFNPDVYRGPVLSSSPAVPFPSTPFQYPVFPFGTNFPLPSTSFSGGSTTYVDPSTSGRLGFPAVHSQLLGPATAVPSQYPRPYIVSLPDCGNNNSAESSRKWGRQGLDLNAGPGGPDIEGRDETSPLTTRQLSVASSQALAEEQARMYPVATGVLKRKEPEGGWDGYKQSSWQ